ncbi:hypothetical protein FYK55_25585 [Roseiconus nitratireducens]|uniref:3-keto-disaccharide hydrolase domain-containing protein n=1 Tax=Roseiconus nitratireducens TaxID=2605748 RepID=A0A5M6D1J9_9BACT|nr:hypothetical protein [Roseiconus nitratireducens]KAA5538975.1 hypothetical protein FYK55_25585 [Roseiconus nitratireducens]
MMFLRVSLSLAVTACASLVAFADKDAAIQPSIATTGTASISESFDSPLSELIRVAKGDWKSSNGVLTGKEVASDHHAAVLMLQKPNRNSVVRFSFKLDGMTNGFHFSLNHRRGHLFRVVVSPSKLAIHLDKDKKDPKSKVLVLDSDEANFAQDTWYTMQVEMVGDRVAVQTDNGAKVEASNPKLDTDKPNYRFVTRGDSLSIDDLKVWEAN